MESSFFISIPHALMILGVLLLVAEIIFFGFATFVLCRRSDVDKFDPR